MHNYRLKHWLYLRVSAVVKPDDIVCVCLGGREGAGEGRVFKAVGSNIDLCMHAVLVAVSFAFTMPVCACLGCLGTYLAFITVHDV